MIEGANGQQGAGKASIEHNMLDERQPCRNCASILADSSLFDALKSEAGVDFSQTPQEFYSAIDHGCLICSAIHEMACHGDYSETAAFRCRPELPSSGSRTLTKNIQVETTRPESYDIKSVRVAIWSAKNRYNFDAGFDVEAQDGKNLFIKRMELSLIISVVPLKTIRQHGISALGR